MAINNWEIIDKFFKLKKVIYKHLEDINLDAVYSFCKSENFQGKVNGNLKTKMNSQEKIDAVTTFITKYISMD